MYFEEPVFDAAAPRLALSQTVEGVLLAIPHLPPNTPRAQAEVALRRMVNRVLSELGETRPVLWYCTPMAVGFTDHLKASVIVYDCTEAPRRGRITPSEWAQRERWLFERADVIFTDSHSLCRHTRPLAQHAHVYPFMSSVDVGYFGRAREQLIEPPDQDEIPHPRVGFCGVIDERVDMALLGQLASTRPDLQFVMVGPIVGLDLATLPQSPNLHWLGAKPQTQLTAYIAGWDVAMLPLSCSDATQFTSPSRAAELLAAGKPVVATPIPNVVEPFGRDGLAWIAEDFGEFSDAIDEALRSDRYARVIHADAYLAEHSWKATWEEMWIYVEQAAASRTTVRNDKARRPKPVGVSYSASTTVQR
ncbi:MAG TPA: glycosyltransferase [Enhygromyxa sp.]|nr:glycosyltransferase [Enhygromyxa sp.]